MESRPATSYRPDFVTDEQRWFEKPIKPVRSSIAMGIPHLIATLEPYATREILRDEQVVIDGPALAYHVLHVCRVNGISQPSYDVLGQTVIQWLDELQKSRVTIRHIFFDGYLPSSKQTVRMERMLKASFRIDEYFNSNSKGCLLKRPGDAVDQMPVFDVFEAANPGTKPPPDPSFLVPATIDAIRGCPRYRDLYSIVPGEADAFCARDVAQHGGMVMTSDSDLLAYHLGLGKVVFLREIYRTAGGELSCLAFCPREIYRRIGLSESTEPWRLAYERKQSPNATVSRLVIACTRPPADAAGYEEFRQQYLSNEAAALPSIIAQFGELPLQLGGLDPRLSELLLQMGPGAAHASIYLPTMIENPLKGTVWEPSMRTRSLAYTVALILHDCPSSFLVYEFRRVRQRNQKGRQVGLLSPDGIASTVNDMVTLFKRISRRKGAGELGQRQWIILAVVLDILGCEEQGKNSQILQTLKQGYVPSAKSGGRLPWDIVHFVAQVQAGLYSMRMLAQVLALMSQDWKSPAGDDLWNVRKMLSEFPSLPKFPDSRDILKILEPAARVEVWEMIKTIAHVGENQEQGVKHGARATKQKSEKTEKPPAGGSRRSTEGNMFGLLSVDT